MKTAILYIAERCNQHCVFCLEVDRSWAPFVDPSTKEVMTNIDRLHDRGANHITFMGGETFFRKDLPRILEHAKSAGFSRVGVTTNGTVLSKKGFIKELVDSGLDFIEFSVHGHTPELTSKIVRTTVSHERQASALDEINELGAPFTIVNVVVCQENKDHLLDIATYVCDKLPRVEKHFKFKFLQMMGLAAESAEDGRSLHFSDVDPTAVGDYLKSRGVPVWFHTFPLCRLDRHKACSHEACVMASDETYFDYDHRGGVGYYDSGHQLEGHVWPETSCTACSLRPLCPGLEASYHRLVGDSELVTQHEDPVPILAAALEGHDRDLVAALKERAREFMIASDRKGYVAAAAARLERLRQQPRPSVAVIHRPEQNLLRFHHPDEPQPLELMLSKRVPNERAYLETQRFALSYRPWIGVEEPGRRPNVAAIMDAACAALEAADAAGLSEEEAITVVGESQADGWVLEECQVASKSASRSAPPSSMMMMSKDSPLG